MVNWSAEWLLHEDKNGVLLQDWCRKHSNTQAHCSFCGAFMSFETQGFHALLQHSGRKKHRDVSAIKYGKSNKKIVSSHHAANSLSTPHFQPASIALGSPLADRVTNAEVLWMLKVASSDFSLRSCDNITDLFHLMFDCDITESKNFGLGRSKVSYALSDGLGPYFLKSLCDDVNKSESGFTLLFDETTTAKDEKQMDILIRYWSENINEVCTRYLTSLMFGRARAEDLKEMFMSLQDDQVLNSLPWNRFFNISSDGPNINRALWRLLNEELKNTGKLGLLPLFVCTIHMVHNGFHKGINVYGQQCEQLAFDLHAWFKVAPCKQEDFRSLSEDARIDDESLFLRHLNTRWLTLVPALERVQKRWEDAKKYFLTYLPNLKEYKRHLPKNQKFKRIENALKNEITSCLQMSFLVNIAPIMNKFLKMFQCEGPLIHIIYHELKNLLSTLMSRFLKAEVISGKKGNELLSIDVKNPDNQLPLNKMNVGTEVLNLLKKCAKECTKTEHLKNMQLAFVTMTKYFQKKLPLDSMFLRDMVCLHPLQRTKVSADAITRIAESMPHIIAQDNISQLRDEWAVLQADDEIPENWFIDGNGAFLRLDHYWAKVFEMKTMSGFKKYKFLSKVVKSCCCLQNGNAAVERSLSDNKNTVTKERTNLSEETIKGLRRGKEFVRSFGGSHKVPVTKGMRLAVRNSYQSLLRRQEEEEREVATARKKKAEEIDEIRKQKESLEKAEQMKGNLEKKEEKLAADEAEVDQSINIAEQLLKEGTIRLTKAIAAKDFTEIDIASALIESANKKLEHIKKHREEQKKIKTDISRKRGSLVDTLMKSTKKKFRQ